MDSLKEAVVVVAAIVVIIAGGLHLYGKVHTGCLFGKCAVVVTN